MEQFYEKGAKSLIKPILIEDELKSSFLGYAMSVIVSRAIPDVRDGLKPVHRRILYTMYQLGFFYNKPFHKSVRVVGEVLGKYHPHGDQAVYQTIVGMVQNFSKRYPLLDGQGNWGSIDGDNAAAMRYTEIRMQKIAEEILEDLDKDTVHFVPNFDESTIEPVVLPSKIPNLLINGTSGIAVGMATSIPPHNLSEILDGCIALIKNENIKDEELFSLIPAPDFPTGGIICGRGGIVKAYMTGKGSLVLRGKIEIEEKNGKKYLVILEIPYQVNKADLIIKIADLVKNKVIDGISNIKDESNKDGIRIVIELKKDVDYNLILNLLYKNSQLQINVTILMLALLDNKPLIFNLRQLLTEFIYHRKSVISKRSQYALNKAKQKEHILNGFILVLNDIDKLINIIKNASNIDEAIFNLNKTFNLQEDQSKAILDLKLHRLTTLEKDKIYQELNDIKILINSLNEILNDENKLKEEVIKELNDIKDRYQDKRKTTIAEAVDILSEHDLIKDEEVLVTLTRKGYIKRVLLNTYEVQHRGGKGKMGISSLDESDDVIQDIFVARNHDELLFFTNLGKIYSINVFELPEGSRISKGRAIINILPLANNEHVVKLLCARDFEDKYLIMLTKSGVIKKTLASSFTKIRSTGIKAISLNDDDELVSCILTSGNDSIVLVTSKGQGIRFSESEVRAMQRQASGVIGIRLHKNDFVIGMEIVEDNKDIIFVTSNGYGKRVSAKDFRIAHRGGYGVKTIPTNSRNGSLIGLALVDDNTDILLIDNNGKIIRLSSKEIRTMKRQASGVRLIKLENNKKLVGLAIIQ